MKIRRYAALAVLLVPVVLLSVAMAAFAGGKPPVPPSISLENTGGVPRQLTKKCEYTLRFESCQIKLTNSSAFPVTIYEVEIGPPQGTNRYERENIGCTVGLQLVALTGSCTDEVKLKANGCAGWTNVYAIRVEETGNPGNREVATLSLEVK